MLGNARFILLACCTVGCAECAPGRVSSGVARLTIRNLGTIVELINEDTRCGFESEAVKSTALVEGKGSSGKVTWSTKDCELDLSQPLEKTDCNGVTTRASGKVTVSAKRIVEGTITGDAENPVAPGRPDAVTIEIEEARFEGFVVTAADDNVLTMRSGSIAGRIKPLLAVDDDLGACSIPTKNVRFEEVVYQPSQLRVDSDQLDFEVPVASSRVSAVHGVIGEEANVLQGEIAIWDRVRNVPADRDGLDPEFDREKHDSSFACSEGLAIPVSYQCGDVVKDQVAQGAARLTVRNFGVIADRLDKDTRCGFSSMAVLSSAELSAPIGSIGDALFTVNGCELDFAPGSIAETKCNGVETKISGKVIVSGTKRLSGRLTGNLETPVVPLSDGPAEVSLAMELQDVEVAEGDTALRWRNGALSGRVHPRTAADAAREGACGFETPIARFLGLTYSAPSDAIVRSGSVEHEVRIDAAMIDAVNGTWGSESNSIAGSITVGGEVSTIEEGLDPDFDQAAFDASWQCGTLELPPRFECGFVQPIAQGAAQLTIKMLGTIAKAIDAEPSCGFGAVTPAITGELGDEGSGTFAIQSCVLDHAEPFLVETDCNGKETWVQGRASVSGPKTLTGFVSGDPVQPIVPTSRDPASLSLSIDLTDFEVWTVPGDDRSKASGALSGTVKPRVGIDTETGACSIVTPVAELSNVAWSDGTLAITSEGRTFSVQVSESSLRAINGNKDGLVNHLEGSLVMDGERIDVEPVLDPDFDQTTFDRSYACLPNLRVPANEEECSLRETLGKGAARLLVMAMGTVANRINADDECGFETRSILIDPVQVVGDVGSPGMMAWETFGCQIAGSAEPYQTDCLDRGTYFSGGMTIDAMRTVHGLRDEIVILVIIRIDSIIPTSHDAVAFDVYDVSFDDFSIYELDPGQTVPERGLMIRSGNLSGGVAPVVGENATTPGTFDVPTPIARLTNLSATDLSVQILFEGKRFNVTIEAADLDAFNGSWAGSGLTNLIDGTIRVDGRTISLMGEALNPDYLQSEFDDRYGCAENLSYLVPPAP